MMGNGRRFYYLILSFIFIQLNHGAYGDKVKCDLDICKNVKIIEDLKSIFMSSMNEINKIKQSMFEIQNWNLIFDNNIQTLQSDFQKISQNFRKSSPRFQTGELADEGHESLKSLEKKMSEMLHSIDTSNTEMMQAKKLFNQYEDNIKEIKSQIIDIKTENQLLKQWVLSVNTSRNTQISKTAVNQNSIIRLGNSLNSFKQEINNIEVRLRSQSSSTELRMNEIRREINDMDTQVQNLKAEFNQRLDELNQRAISSDVGKNQENAILNLEEDVKKMKKFLIGIGLDVEMPVPKEEFWILVNNEVQNRMKYDIHAIIKAAMDKNLADINRKFDEIQSKFEIFGKNTISKLFGEKSATDGKIRNKWNTLSEELKEKNNKLREEFKQKVQNSEPDNFRQEFSFTEAVPNVSEPNT